jgi:PEGA domain-containing protein
MEPAVAPRTAPAAPIVFQDALGERRRLDASGADAAEVLCLRSELTSIPSFEFALRERASRLAAFRHSFFGRVRGVDRLNDPAGTLAVVSDHTRGLRLSALLSENGPRPITIDITVALHFIRQLVSAVSMLHETARDVAHGAIGPERIVVTPNARIVVVEYVLGAALEQLRFSRERYWRELRVPLPASPGLPRFDHRADMTQIGVVALSLILGRTLREDEYIAHCGDLVASASMIPAKGGGLEPLPVGLRPWLMRALQLDPRQSFTSALEARGDLEAILASVQDEPAAVVPAPTVERMAAAPSVEPTPAARMPTPVPKEDEKAPVVLKPAAKWEAVAEPKPATESKPAVEPKPIAEPKPAPLTAVAITERSEHREPYRDFSDPVDAPTRLLSKLTASSGRIAAIAVAAVALMGFSIYGVRRMIAAPTAAANATGTLSVTTNPAGAQVKIDGEVRGVTPLSVALKAGPHKVELRGNGEPRTVPITIAAGAQISQYIDLPNVVPTTTVGHLQIRTEPAGAQVSVDGIARGRSPVLVEGLAAGDHVVTLESDRGIVKQTVNVVPATTASLVVPLTAADGGAPVSGWLSVTAPVDVQIFESKRLLGTSQSDRIMVSAGRHEIEIVNEVVGYRSTRVVQVPAGKVTPIRIDFPKGTIAVNAVPWAEVWIDGERVGETPMGNLPIAIGPHEIVFRNPDLGELRHAVTVTLNAPARVSVDLRKKP